MREQGWRCLGLSFAGWLLGGVTACGSVQSSQAHDAGIDNNLPIDASVPDAANPNEFLSCASAPRTCGEASADSCCTSLVVPGGTYDRSFDLANDTSSGTTAFPATISTFRLDKYEVAVARFRAFVTAGLGTQAHPPGNKDGAHKNIPGSGWDPNWNSNLLATTADLIAALKCDSTFQTWTDTAGGNENKPISCVSWYEAAAFCAWDGGYLPTEGEWNYAAAGGDQQRAYPWSSPGSSLSITSDNASYNDGTDCVGDSLPGCALSDLVGVGTKFNGTSRWGQVDMAGNVLEWVLDWASPYATPCSDCAQLTPSAHREIRGGSYDSPASNLRTGFRLVLEPTDRNSLVGFRCARAP